MNNIQTIALHEAARYRYLNYAMSVITSRALPDVRDGLKPVQRRILFAMYHNLHLKPEGRYRKSAAVVGEVMAKYHPHGDSSIYDAMVRMAQPFSLRHMLVDGQGNFGSLDGDGAAAMRYTEAKLRPISMELLTELKQKTIHYRPTYDGQLFEPIVLPAQFPNLLINGSEGIAVGMSTRIPPHNLRNTIDCCVTLIDDPAATIEMLAKKIKAPDFPTGGLILNSRQSMEEIYKTGQGSFRIRGCWELEKDGRRSNIIITQIPYTVNKATLVEKIGHLIANKKVPQLTDVRDESTDEIRVVLALRNKHGKNAEQEMRTAMAYLCRHTPLQINIPMNMTCLIPSENPDVPTPLKANLHDVIRHWLDFRFDCVRRRFIFELEKLRQRIHILEGFAKAFDALDEIIRIIRQSDGKPDAHEQLIERFGFDDQQTEAILELKLYKLAKLEILVIQEELNEKRDEASKIDEILSSNDNLWKVIRNELLELRKLYGEPRRTKIGGESAEVVITDEAAYIVDEDTYIIVTREGWIKRQARFKSITKIRIRDKDQLLCVTKARTKTTVSFYSNIGGVYVMRVADLPATTGYGEPLQKHFSFADGERIIGVVSHDPRSCPPKLASEVVEDEAHPPPYGIAISQKGRIIRFSLAAHKETTNKNGRRYMKPEAKNDSILAIYPACGNEWTSIASHEGKALCFPIKQIPLVRGAGKGVIAIKLDPIDRIIAFELTSSAKEGVSITTSRGREVTIHPAKYEGKRAARGATLIRRGTLQGWTPPLFEYHKQWQEEESSEEHSDESTEETSIEEPPSEDSNSEESNEVHHAKEPLQNNSFLLFPNFPRG